MIKELIQEKEWLEAFPVLQELRTHLNKSTYLDFLYKMREEGYKLFALYDNEQVVAVTGIAIRTNFYYEKHLFIYDLVTQSSQRSKGYGERLLSYIHQYAIKNGCGIVALESGLFREEAHRFYEVKFGYEKFCYSFKKVL